METSGCRRVESKGAGLEKTAEKGKEKQRNAKRVPIFYASPLINFFTRPMLRFRPKKTSRKKGSERRYRAVLKNGKREMRKKRKRR